MRSVRTLANLNIINGKAALILFTVCLLLLLPKQHYSYKAKTPAYQIKKVVIDAGHGGHDPGTIGYSKTKEKTVALAVALKVGGYIEEYFPDVEVVYTRKTDVFIELHERANIANKQDADLFISIHCNAFSSSSVNGTEVYVLGLHRSEDNLKVAKRENSVILMEDDYNERYDGFDPSAPQSHIIFSMLQNAFLEQSINFAEKVDEQFKTRVNRPNRGVKQAGFMVLYKTAMPSTLIELGFISNQKEEAFLTTEQGQAYMASAIYRAFKEYKIEMEKNVPGGPGISEATNVVPHPNDTNDAPDPGPTPVVEEVEKEEEEPAPPAKVETPKSTVVYKIQFLTSGKELPSDNASLKKVTNVSHVVVDGLYKYMAGTFNNYDEALEYQGKVRELGFSGAFMVAYKDGQRISIQDALEETDP